MSIRFIVPIGIDELSGDVIGEIAYSAKKVIEERCIKAKADYDRIFGQSVTWKEVVCRPGARFHDALGAS